MKVYLDDERPTPEGWTRTKTVRETIALLETGRVTHLSLDHDLGDDAGIGTGYDVLLWIERAMRGHGFKPPSIRVHSTNVSARVKMGLAVEAIGKFAEESK